MADASLLFSPEVPEQHPRLMRLFDQAKQDFWDEATVVDWDRGFQIPVAQRRPLARILSIIYYGERAAMEVSAQLVTLVKDEEAKFVLAAQVIEEAKHVAVFRRVLLKLDDVHPVDPWARRLLWDLIRVKHPAAKLLGMQLIIENVANHLFHYISEAVPDPLLKEILAFIARDEKKHTGLAAIYLPTILAEVGPVELQMIKLRQVYWAFCLDRVIYNHRFDADALGIDLHSATLKVLESQDRLVRSMGTSRGVFRNHFLESISLNLYRKHAERCRATRIVPRKAA